MKSSALPAATRLLDCSFNWFTVVFPLMLLRSVTFFFIIESTCFFIRVFYILCEIIAGDKNTTLLSVCVSVFSTFSSQTSEVLLIFDFLNVYFKNSFSTKTKSFSINVDVLLLFVVVEI